MNIPPEQNSKKNETRSTSARNELPLFSLGLEVKVHLQTERHKFHIARAWKEWVRLEKALNVNESSCHAALSDRAFVNSLKIASHQRHQGIEDYEPRKIFDALSFRLIHKECKMLCKQSRPISYLQEYFAAFITLKAFSFFLVCLMIPNWILNGKTFYGEAFSMLNRCRCHKRETQS